MNQDDASSVSLTIETGTHSAFIRRLLVTADGSRVITASLDKSIRIWDVASRRETQKILGQIGPGKDGEIQRIALTPDDRYLFVAVRFSENGDEEALRTILRIYDLLTGNLIAWRRCLWMDGWHRIRSPTSKRVHSG